MTDRFNALIVVLEEDIRSDDAQGLIDAILRLRGVLSVSGNVQEMSDHIAQARARHELGQKLIDVLYPMMKLKGK